MTAPLDCNISCQINAGCLSFMHAPQKRFEILHSHIFESSYRIFSPRLEELERALFRIGRIGRSSIDQWFSRLHERLVASSIGKEAPAQLADGDEEILEPLPKRHCSHHPSGID